MIGKTPRILIVDDDEDTRENLSDILSDVGYETETASDANMALSLVADVHPSGHCKYDLCLLDFKMPGMDGADLLTEIRTKYPNLRTILITAYAGDDGVQRALAAGTWNVLRKPVDIKTLLGMISEALAS